MATYTDEDIFGDAVVKPVAAKRSYSDDEVFGTPKPKAAAPKRKIYQDTGGAAARVMEKIPFGDELNAGAYALPRAAYNVAKKGMSKGQGIQGRIVNTIGDAFNDQLADTRAISKRYKENHPLAAAGADAVGNVAPTAATMLAPQAMLPLKAAQAAAATKAASAVAPKTGLLANLAARGTAAGKGLLDASMAAGATAAGNMEGNLGERVAGGLKAATDPVNLAVGALTGQVGAGKIAKAPKRPKAKDFDDLADGMRVEAKRVYKQVDDMGIGYTPQAVKDLRQGIRDVTTGIPGNVIKGTEGSDAVRAVLRKYIVPTLRAAENAKGLTMSEIEGMRKAVGQKLLRHKDPDARRLGSAITEQIDQFFDAATPAQVNKPAFGGVFNQWLKNPSVNGPAPSPEEANRAIVAARAAFKQHAKAKRIADDYHDATLRAATTHTGANATNTMRQVIGAMAKRRGGRPLQGATPAEKKQIQRIARGTAGQNLMRLYGSGSADRGGLAIVPSLLATGASFATGNPIPAMVAGGAIASRHAAQASTKKEIEKLMGLIAHGDPKTAALARRQLDAQTKSNPQVAAMIDQMQEIAAAGAGRMTENQRHPEGR